MLSTKDLPQDLIADLKNRKVEAAAFNHDKETRDEACGITEKDIARFLFSLEDEVGQKTPRSVIVEIIEKRLKDPFTTPGDIRVLAYITEFGINSIIEDRLRKVEMLDALRDALFKTIKSPLGGIQ